MSQAFLVSFYLLFPALVIWLCYRFRFVNKIGAVLICYVAGAVIGNFGIVPADSAPLQNLMTDLLVALALPLLVFTMDMKQWSKLAGKALLSFAFATISIIVVAFIGVTLIRNVVPDAWKLGGMAVGVYTGGTPNLAAIKTALNVDSSTFIVMHTYDTVLSFIYIFFCASIAQRVFGLFLPAFTAPSAADAGSPISGSEPGMPVAGTPGSGTTAASASHLKGSVRLRASKISGIDAERSEDIAAYGGIFRPGILAGLAAALVLSVAILGAGLFVSSLVPQSYSTAAAILVITTLGILCSFIPRVRRIEKTFQLGMYVIYAFCTVVASLANIGMLININWPLMGFVTLCIFGSMLLQAVLCRLANVDVDTFIITSVSAICSPPFVPVVAAGLKNRFILLSGITTGIIGYAIGNYLGISFAYLIR